tara:strand:+ start:283 stop:507 length:225 start_codon:yes stop_codon:yes gene_type:complete
MKPEEELRKNVKILSDAAINQYNRAEKFKQLLVDIIKKQSNMQDYGHPQFHEFQEYLSDVLIEMYEIEGLNMEE